MFDLKAKLLEKGLVTKEQVQKIDQEKQNKKFSNKSERINNETDITARERAKALLQLKSSDKNEQYLIVRKWVDFNRRDRAADISLDCEKFFIPAKDGQITWLTLKKEIIEEIKNGHLGVIAYMSNHGLTHAVVPRDIAEDIGEVFPDWLKVLNDKN
jgi:hypothetical protein